MKNILILLPILAVTALFSCKPTQKLAKTEPEVKTAPPSRNMSPFTYGIVVNKKIPWTDDDILTNQFYTDGGKITLTYIVDEWSKSFDGEGNPSFNHVNHIKRSIVDNNSQIKVIGPIDKSRKIFVCRVDLKGHNAYITFVMSSNGFYYFKNPGGLDETGNKVLYKNEPYSANTADEVVHLAFYPKINESSDIEEEHTTGVSVTSSDVDNLIAPTVETPHYPGLKNQETKPEAKYDIDEILKELQKKKYAEPAKKLEEKKPEVKPGPKRSRPSPK